MKQEASQLLERYLTGERDFRGASLEGANFDSTNLSDVLLNHACLKGANLTNSDLGRVIN
jgi:uncharacterized protein YjbI with pentapeptide repeats